MRDSFLELFAMSFFGCRISWNRIGLTVRNAWKTRSLLRHWTKRIDCRAIKGQTNCFVLFGSHLHKRCSFGTSVWPQLLALNWVAKRKEYQMMSNSMCERYLGIPFGLLMHMNRHSNKSWTNFHFSDGLRTNRSTADIMIRIILWINFCSNVQMFIDNFHWFS